MVGAAVEASKGGSRPVGEHHSADERIELVGQLQRSLVLLRGCDAPGIRAQITSLIASLHARLHHATAPQLARGRRVPTPLIPGDESALRLSGLECRSYAIQCESLASMAGDPQQRDVLRALARLWRALATE